MSDFHLLLEDQILRLMRYASALTRDPEAAGGLVEDTVKQALATRHQWRRGTDLRVWLLAILHDQRSNPFRQADPTAAPPALELDPAALATLSDFDRAMGRLPEEQRAVILLIGLEGIPNDKTASILRISAATVRSRLARGLETLRRLLAETDRPGLAHAA